MTLTIFPIHLSHPLLPLPPFVFSLKQMPLSMLNSLEPTPLLTPTSMPRLTNPPMRDLPKSPKMLSWDNGCDVPLDVVKSVVTTSTVDDGRFALNGSSISV